MKRRILILGGTSEARALSAQLARRGDLDITLSLAGRTVNPAAHDVPVRSGGFGGAEGLAAFLRSEAIDVLVDATHPYAVRISANAVDAAEAAGIPLVSLVRPEWRAVTGDRWRQFDTVADAVIALGDEPRRVFVALGRQEVAPLFAAPWHHYLIRSVDPIDPPLALPDVRYILARGPFEETDERRLLADAGIEAIIAKNSGGAATYGKIAAARALGIEVFLLKRPALPTGMDAETVDEAIALLDHLESAPLEERGE